MAAKKGDPAVKKAPDATAATKPADSGSGGNSPEAVMTAIRDAVAGKRTFGEVLGITAGQAYNMAQMGYRLLQEGQLDDARIMFQGLVTLNPKDPYMHLALGSVYHRQCNSEDAIKQAIAEYTKAIELDPKMTNAYANRGELFLGSGQADKGLADLKKAIELDPKGEDPSTVRARAIIATAAAKLKEKAAGAKQPATAGKKK